MSKCSNCKNSDYCRLDDYDNCNNYISDNGDMILVVSLLIAMVVLIGLLIVQ